MDIQAAATDALLTGHFRMLIADIGGSLWNQQMITIDSRATTAVDHSHREISLPSFSQARQLATRRPTTSMAILQSTVLVHTVGILFSFSTVPILIFLILLRSYTR